MGSGPDYTEAEDAIIREFYPRAPISELREKLPNRDWRAIKFRAYKLRVRRYRLSDHFLTDGSISLIASMTEAERGYLAGLIDSDGSIIFYRVKRTSNLGWRWEYRLTVIVNNTDKRMIDWCCEKLPAGTSRVQGKPGIRRKLCLYGFGLSTAQSVVLLRDLAPYLVIKREQAELFVNGYRHMSEEQRDAIYHQLRSFKTKGKQRCLPSDQPTYAPKRITLPI